jgi:hypothetical protein
MAHMESSAFVAAIRVQTTIFAAATGNLRGQYRSVPSLASASISASHGLSSFPDKRNPDAIVVFDREPMPFVGQHAAEVALFNAQIHMNLIVASADKPRRAAQQHAKFMER